MTQPRNPFTRTGALARHDPLFLGRAAELAQLEQACLHDHKSFMLVYGGRQNGKTSLLLRLEASLRARLPERVRVCRVDFQDIPRVTTDAAFQHLIAELRRNLPHLSPAPVTAGIPELRGFLEQALAGDEVSRLVLLLDELARLPEATREDLAHVIRALHTHRLVSPALAKTQLILAGGLELYNLAIVQASTLRNVCEIVRLGDLREADAVKLIAEGLGLIGVAPEQARLLGHAVYRRVGGHPYLTQRIGGLLVESYFQGQMLNEDLVEALCWGLLDEDDALLEHLRRSLVELQLEDAARRLLTAGQRTSVTDDHTARLELLGLARRDGRIWVPRSPLLTVALADWLGFTAAPSQTLAETATTAQRAAQAGYIRDLKLEQAAITQRAAQAATPAEQIRLERRANNLTDEISRLEAAQATLQPAPAAASVTQLSAPSQPSVSPLASEQVPAIATPEVQAPAASETLAELTPIAPTPEPATTTRHTQTYAGRARSESLGEHVSEHATPALPPPMQPSVYKLPAEQREPVHKQLSQPTPVRTEPAPIWQSWRAIIGTLLALVLIGMLVTRGVGTPQAPRTTPTQVITPTTAAQAPTTNAAAITAAPAATQAPTAVLPLVRVPELVPVPGGDFLMGSEDSDSLAYTDEKPQHILYLPDYWIGKTEVTNAEFRQFVEGDGYTNQQYWTEAGWGWRQTLRITKPRYWDDTRWNDDMQPVMGVSWFEAVAYCRWLSAQTGHEFRLPSEAEWEKAARGTDGRIWPWGNSWELNRARSAESGYDKTNLVGQYPAGASPYGALDMAGNVWEWCATKWGKTYPYQIEDEWQAAYLETNDAPVLRGGSYSSEQKYVRVSFHTDHPLTGSRYFSVGLRVASHSRPDSGS